MSENNLSTVSSVLFVCMGNICRSPSAEAVFIHKAKEKGLKLLIDSAGTISSHAKEKPDHRAIKAGEARGYSFKGLKARKVIEADFEKFDLILPMDQKNLEYLLKKSSLEHHYKIKLFLDFAENFEDDEVPDPYYGGAKGFQYVLDLVEDASDGLLTKIQ